MGRICAVVSQERNFELFLTFPSLGAIRTLGLYGFRPNNISLIDSIDLKILYILQNNGRSRLADIAEEVELSAPAVMERVKKLEASGVIRGYQALLDGKKVGKDYKRRKGNLLSPSAARINVYPSGSGQLSPSGISPVLKGGPVKNRRFREANLQAYVEMESK